MKKNFSTSISDRGAILAVGVWTKVCLPDGREVTRFEGDLEIRLVFNLRQAEAFLREKENEVVAEELVEAYNDISKMRWAHREDVPSPVRLKGEAAILIYGQILTAVFDKALRATLIQSADGFRLEGDNHGRQGKMPASGPVAEVIPIDRRSKGNPDVQ